MARKLKTETACPVEFYARAVIAGEVVAGHLVKMACERHLRDLETGPARGLKWDRDGADHAVTFFSHLRLPADGEIDGKPFFLQPFQLFIVGSLFGWKGEDGFRRFRTAYVEIGKGNGKTPTAAGIGLYGLVGDNEAGAEVYSAATTAFQAGILFRDSRRMAEASPELRSRLKIDQHNIAYLKTDSFMRPVSSEHKQLSGPRPHMALIDEIHEHPNALVLDKMRAGTKGRRQALVFEITNSGYDRTTVCWHHHEYSVKVLEGLIENDSWFAYVCQLDPCEACRAEGKTQPDDNCEACDDWHDEEVWLKANPGLDTILPRKYLREQVAEADGIPAKESIVKRLNFCLWTEAAVHAIPMDKWDACKRPVDLGALKGRQFYGGLDIGATSDFTAFAAIFPHDDAEEVVVPVDPQQPDGEKKTVHRRSVTLVERYWLPREPVKRDSRMAEVIQVWCRQGLVRVTEGNVVDYDQVLEDLVAFADEYELRVLAFDRGFQGGQMGNNLMKHFGEKVVICPQGIISMNAPFRELIELVKQGRFHHAGHPVTRWMVSNTAAEMRGGLIKPSKEHSAEKIDVVTAATMAVRELMIAPAESPWYTPGSLRN